MLTQARVFKPCITLSEGRKSARSRCPYPFLRYTCLRRSVCARAVFRHQNPAHRFKDVGFAGVVRPTRAQMFRQLNNKLADRAEVLDRQCLDFSCCSRPTCANGDTEVVLSTLKLGKPFAVLAVAEASLVPRSLLLRLDVGEARFGVCARLRPPTVCRFARCLVNIHASSCTDTGQPYEIKRRAASASIEGRVSFFPSLYQPCPG